LESKPLIKDCNGHYHVNQWVEYGIVKDRPPHNRAFWYRHLWDHGPVQEEGGFHTEEEVKYHLNKFLDLTYGAMYDLFRDVLPKAILNPDHTGITLNDTLFIDFRRHMPFLVPTPVTAYAFRNGYDPVPVTGVPTAPEAESDVGTSALARMCVEIRDAIMEMAAKPPIEEVPEAVPTTQLTEDSHAAEVPEDS